jgi:hypothetical protein
MSNCIGCKKKLGLLEGYSDSKGEYCKKCYPKRDSILKEKRALAEVKKKKQSIVKKEKLVCEYCDKKFNKKSEFTKHNDKCKDENVLINQGIFAGVKRVTRREKKELEKQQKENMKILLWIFIIILALSFLPIAILFFFG